MEQLIAKMSFILIVGGLIGILALMNTIAQYQSKRRTKVAGAKQNTSFRTQAKVIVLPSNVIKTSTAKIEVRQIQEELV